MPELYSPTMEEIEQRNWANGQAWFSRSNMAYFKSKTYDVYPGGFFISSERDFWDTQRLYTVRRADPDGTIHTVGEFQQYNSLRAARKAAQLASIRAQAGFIE